MSLDHYLREIATILANPVLEPRDAANVDREAKEAEFRVFQRANQRGIAIIPEIYGDSPRPVMRSTGGDFAKWLKIHAPTIPVDTREVR